MEENFRKLEGKLGVTFNNIELLKQAFIHRSYLNEHREVTLDHNERLEFLGDAVLELIVTDFLYHKYPDATEGDLTAYRSALVNTNSLSDVATELLVNDYLLLSRGESKDIGRARQFILANTFEALVGAIYLDQSYEAAREFLSRILLPKIDEIVEKRLWQDAKSRFQELSQEKEGVTPSYETLGEAGPDHDKRFTIGVYLENTLIAEGEGRSKQEAEQEAAQAALEAKNWH